ncbi:bacteriohemerythrin [uncultured Thiodictyon sp.]|uniref:bacteriohemerythrin n=1 Tax=uncultured Thiodictyon sp. TaxID=1846217 RepID=UPI0025E6A7FC|nr:bacteriohemerythrin [uncultured Thiodictyon sp.]
MIYWSWDPSLSVGIDVIDSQHRRIVDYINELAVARNERDKEEVTQVLMNLVDYTNTHFAFEEELMKNAGYPLSDSHKKVHEAFISNIKKFVQQHEEGRDVTSKLMSTLQIWLTNHIKRDDKDYAPYAAKMMNPGWLKKTLNRFFG